MRKRILSLLLALVLIVCISPIPARAHERTAGTYISFYCHDKTGYVGLTDVMEVYYRSDAEEPYTMSSSDESIVRLSRSDSGAYTAEYLKLGTAVITVTTESGEYDCCTVTVREMEEFKLNETKNVTVQPFDTLVYVFPYEQYGEYIFFSENTKECWLKSKTADTDPYAYDVGKYMFTLDETDGYCWLYVHNAMDYPLDYTLSLMVPVPVESISLTVKSAEPHYVGQIVSVEAETHPKNARKEAMSWTSSDESVATMYDWSGLYYAAKLVGSGTATIRVRSEDSGASATVDITAVEVTPGSSFDIALEPEESFQFTFFPRETGEYVIYALTSETISEIWPDVYNEDTEEYLNWQERTVLYRTAPSGEQYFCLYYTLEAETAYTFTFKDYRASAPSGTVYLNKTVPAEKLYFDREQITAYEYRTTDNVTLIAEPLHAESQIIWAMNGDAASFYVPQEQTYAELYPATPGTAVLTATSSTGVSAACEITVLELKQYSVLSGRKVEWVQGSDETLTIEIDADPSKFDRMYATFGDIAPAHYSVTADSADGHTIITLSPDALTGLEASSYRIFFEYTDGEAQIRFYVIAPAEPETPFTDVPADSFYYAPVLWALENGITTGATADSFNPNGQCLRAHVVTFLHRAAESPEPTSASNPFIDVKTSDFFYKSVLWAVEKGITNGVSATKFGSYDVCNRAAVVTFLWRAAGSPEPESTANPFTDVKPTDFYYKPVLWAVENGITNGISETEFGPNAPCNRAQVVTFLYRAYNK